MENYRVVSFRGYLLFLRMRQFFLLTAGCIFVQVIPTQDKNKAQWLILPQRGVAVILVVEFSKIGIRKFLKNEPNEKTNI